MGTEILNATLVILQILFTVAGAVVAIKRSLTDPLNRRLFELKEAQRETAEELRSYIASEIARIREEQQVLRDEVEELRAEVKVIQREYVTKEMHYRDVSGWRGDISKLEEKFDILHRWLTEKILEVTKCPKNS